MYEQIASNKRRSILLIVGFVARRVPRRRGLRHRRSATAWQGMVIALVVAGGAGLRLVLEVRRGRPGGEPGPARPIRQQYQRLYNLVEGLCIASGLPKPAHLHRRRPGPERLRHRPQPQARRHRRHHRAAREDEPGRARGRAGPRAVSHIKNYDILVSTLAVTLVGAVALLADIADPDDVVERRPGPPRRRPRRRQQPARHRRLRLPHPGPARRQGHAGRRSAAAARRWPTSSAVPDDPLPARADLGAREAAGRHDGHPLGLPGHGPPVDRAADVGRGRRGQVRLASTTCSTPTRRSRSASPPSGSSEVPMTTILRTPTRRAAGAGRGRRGGCSPRAAAAAARARRRPTRPPRRRPSTTTTDGDHDDGGHDHHASATDDDGAAGPSTRSPASRSPDAPATPRPAIVVKIDNHTDARPQTGLNQADIVYRGDRRGHHPLLRRLPVDRRRRRSGPSARPHHRRRPARPARTARCSSGRAATATCVREIGGGQRRSAWPTARAPASTATVGRATSPPSTPCSTRARRPSTARSSRGQIAARRRSSATGPSGRRRPRASPSTVIDAGMNSVPVHWAWDAGAGPVDPQRERRAPRRRGRRARSTRPTSSCSSCPTGPARPTPARREAVTVGEGDAWIFTDGKVDRRPLDAGPTSTSPATFTDADGKPVAPHPGPDVDRAGRGRRTHGTSGVDADRGRAAGRSAAAVTRRPRSTSGTAERRRLDWRHGRPDQLRSPAADRHVPRQAGPGRDAEGRRHHGRRHARAGQDRRGRRRHAPSWRSSGCRPTSAATAAWPA